ncbi:chemotaxis protein CheW [Tepidamorphus sp. 3E244]|uniref:hybrid sensor histidine kinase/response regulator n=1 Tax=Tepidamorphus sp. 3E244 TaxID=3385498 RepID=UPI0038FC671C
MDDLLSEFLTETHESLDVVDVQLVQFEQEPNNAKILDNVFRLVHTIKGTCGFLGLPRLEALAHAGESLMGKFRDGAPVTQEAVSLILKSIDRIKEILNLLGETGAEPEGSDDDLIAELDRLSEEGARAISGEAAPAEEPGEAVAEADEAPAEAVAEQAAGESPGVFQELERPLKPGEVSLDDLERAFLEAEGPDLDAIAAEVKAAAPESKKEPAKAEDKAKREAPVQQASLRVNVETLEHLITMVSELVLTRNQLLEIVRRHEDSEFKVPLQRLSNVTAELQEGVMKTRMQPIGNAWQKLPRIVRDLAQELDKDIELEMIGAETELDRQVLELIKDPLTHMVRNSADHGLETTEDRVAKGKSGKGLIRLSAYHEGGHIIISIADDGRGLNAAKIRQKVIEKGLATEAEMEKMSETQIQRFIFNAGFSTAAAITSVSGRGVGMDVVRTNIELIGGSIDLKSVQGEGTTFTIKIPLTLAIVSALIVECAGQRFAIPQLAVVELVRAQSDSDHKIERIKDTPVLRLRNQLLPLMSLRDILGMEHATATADGDEGSVVEDADSGFIVVMQVGGNIFGIVVDGVFHTEEIVVKPMSTMLRNIPTFSGNTILGDGSVIMILDPNGVANTIRNDVVEALANTSAAAEERSSARELTSLLLFTAGSEDPKAVPLSLVTRLEEIPVEKIERSNGRLLVQYRGSLMPLIFVSEEVKLRDSGTQPMLVFTENNRSMGLVIDKIVDIVEDELNIEVQSALPGILGSAVVKDHATEIIDVGHFLPMAFDDWFGRKEMSAASLDRTIMLVDDSPFFLNMLSPVLKSAGYKVKTYSSGAAAFAALEAGEEFDLVVSDIEMPEMNGFELAERISRSNSHSRLPVIALSSHSEPAAIERGRQAGFHDFVAKFDRHGLLAAIGEFGQNRTGVAA